MVRVTAARAGFGCPAIVTEHGMIDTPEGIESQPFGHLGEIAHLGPTHDGCTNAKADPLYPVIDPGMHMRTESEVILCRHVSNLSVFAWCLRLQMYVVRTDMHLARHCCRFRRRRLPSVSHPA